MEEEEQQRMKMEGRREGRKLKRGEAEEGGEVKNQLKHFTNKCFVPARHV